MTQTFLIQFIEILSFTLQILIIIRVLMSWVNPHPSGPLGRFLMEVTEPILKPFQRILPPMAGIDFSPILALVTLQILASLAIRTLG
ncbi:MAG: YggT family protein [bacterium]|nr:YggT family protein [bacterium]